jgi:[NiFe] hydrogenase diaphorase moiety large subunit
MPDGMQESIAHIINKNTDTDYLLQHLIEIQQQYQYIPDLAIEMLGQVTGLSETHIKAVISFYSFLSLEYQGDYRILFSDNFTDRIGNNQLLLERLSTRLQDVSVSIGLTSCTGLCDQGPGLLVNGIAINNLDDDRIDQIAELILSGQPVNEWPETLFQIANNIQRSDFQLKLQADKGIALKKALELGADATLQLVDDSGLRGRGGAGFKTASKWSFCRQNESENRYVVCNADEGEPGTFKDRVLLCSYADEMIEGMTICASVIGAEQGLIYLRGEYRYLLQPLEKILQHRRSKGLLGKNILGQQGVNFEIEIHLGAGAYICGEESSLIESLEGKRGIPRIRPPFPVQQGYKNQPTVVNNVETFWSVCNILSEGAEWFKQAGTEQSSGTRLLSISGDCERPGIYEYAFGVSMADILKDCGGQNAQAVQMAGAAGTTVLAKDFDRRMSFEDLATGGSFMVIGPERHLIDLLDNFATFFKHESCGFCTPCRVGSNLIAEIIQRFKHQQGSRVDLQQLESISRIMKETSFCGLGSSAPTAFMNAIEQNRGLFDGLMKTDSDGPVFDLEQATSEFRRITQ